MKEKPEYLGLVFDVSSGWRRWYGGEDYRPFRWYHRALDNLGRWWRTRGWRRRQGEFERTGTRYYGNGGTIHSSGWLDVETFNGTVVAVWFRCQPLPFQQTEVDGSRATDMETMYGNPEEGKPAGMLKKTELCGVEVRDLDKEEQP